MRKFLLAALPLASMVFVAGCCGTDDDCSPCSAGIAAPSAVVAAPAPAAVVEGDAIAYHEGAVIHNYPRGLRHGGGLVQEIGEDVSGVVHGIGRGASSVVHGVGSVVHGAGSAIHDAGSAILHGLHIADADSAPVTGGGILSEAEYQQMLAEGKVTAIPGYEPSASRTSEPVMASSTTSPVSVSRMVASLDSVKDVETETVAVAPVVAPVIAPVVASIAAPVIDPVAPVVAPVVAMSTKKDDVEEAITADQLVSPSMVITPAQIVNSKVLAKSELAPVTEVATQQQTLGVEPTVRTIPGMPLPEGWDYIHEQDLSGGYVNEMPEQFVSQVAKSGTDI